MDERLFYSLVLIVSMMLLCLMIPVTSDKEMKKQQLLEEVDLKSQLITKLLYPKLMAQLSESNATTSSLKINSQQINLQMIEPIDENHVSIKLLFSAFNNETVYADYKATYIIDSFGHIEAQTLQRQQMDETLSSLVKDYPSDH